MKRQRGRGRKPGNPANRTFESNGPEVKIRGNATQIHDKYLQLARDASSSGDRVRAENLYQHAEHYFRIIQANQPKRDPAAEDGAENAEANGENADGEEQSQGDGNERRGRSRGRGRGRRQHEETAASDGETSESGEAVAGEAAPESADSADGDEEAPRRRTRRPRRTRSSEDGDSAEASSETTEKASEDSESEAA
jgi:hypothetical protein